MLYPIIFSLMNTTMFFGMAGSGKEVAIRNEVVINRPIETVFNFLKNFENMPRWNYYLVSVTNTSGGRIGVGTVFPQVRKSDSQYYKITGLEYPGLITMETMPPERHLIMNFKITQKGSTTVLEDTWYIKASPLLALVAKNKVRRAVYANLLKLKTLLENGIVTLQDGRIEKL